MTFRESEFVELKEIYVEDIKKEIIAFANCVGGKLYVGVRNDGTAVGLSNPDAVALQVSNAVRDSIKPDLTMFIHYETLDVDGKQILEIDVQQGTGRPYYIVQKGLRPEGVYVRQGYSSVPATDTAIRNMIKETDGDSFEGRRSLIQELYFVSVSKEFERRNIEFGPKQMQTLKMVNSDGIYTNLGLLMSDRCIHTIKVALFQGTNQEVFKDRREFTGSLLEQLNNVYEYIDLRNQIHADFDKLLRIDKRDYPEVAIREALLNLIVHRDYSLSASALISIYDDRIELLSVGGLLPGIYLADVLMGLSVCRNQNLANIFYRLRLIEACGTGLSKIMNAYSAFDRKPIIETTANAFKIILPNINAESSSIGEAATANPAKINNEDIILKFANEKGAIVRTDVEKLLNVSSSTASRILGHMVMGQRLVKYGRARGIKYTVPNSN